MFGVFKKLFSKPESPPTVAATVTEEPERAPAPAAAPPPAPAEPAPAPMRISTESGDLLALPLDEILSGLPYTMTPLVMSRPGGSFSLPLSEALKQLPTGAVRIAFADLRRGSPLGTFAADSMHDHSLIDLPLPLVLKALGAGALERRSDQRRIEVPDEVTGVFMPRLGQSRLPPTVSIARPRPQPQAQPPPAPRPAPLQQAPIPAPVALKPITPLPLPSAPRQTTSFASAPAAPKPPATATAPLAFAAPAAPSGSKIITTVEAVSGAWPEPVLEEIKNLGLGSATISIPVSHLEAGMKAGRIVFTWAEVAEWLSTPPPPSPHAESQVELPLKVVAPLFLAKHRPAAPRKVVTSGDTVLTVFTGVRRQAATPAAPAPAAPEALHVPAEMAAQPSKTEWTPEEVVRRVMELPGISGALLAATDGLLVAGRLPAPLKAETVAAFLPQIFKRVGDCAEAAQLGSLRALKLWAGLVPCAMFKAGGFYLVVLGQPGQSLPEAALERIADEMPLDKP